MEKLQSNPLEIPVRNEGLSTNASLYANLRSGIVLAAMLAIAHPQNAEARRPHHKHAQHKAPVSLSCKDSGWHRGEEVDVSFEGNDTATINYGSDAGAVEVKIQKLPRGAQCSAGFTDEAIFFRNKNDFSSALIRCIDHGHGHANLCKAAGKIYDRLQLKTSVGVGPTDGP